MDLRRQKTRMDAMGDGQTARKHRVRVMIRTREKWVGTHHTNRQEASARDVNNPSVLQTCKRPGGPHGYRGGMLALDFGILLHPFSGQAVEKFAQATRQHGLG